MLTASSESDFKIGAVQGETIGVFQQDPRWWKGNLLDVRVATTLFIKDFVSKQSLHVLDPIVDCWLTQRWQAPDPTVDQVAFYNAKETQNYVDHKPAILDMIATRKVK